MTEIYYYTVLEKEKDWRLDRWFKRQYPSIQHSYLEKLFRTGQIRVEGKRIRGNYKLIPGQKIRIPPFIKDMNNGPKKNSETRVYPKELLKTIKENVLYCDDDILVLNKPSGIAVQGGSKLSYHIDMMLDELKFGLHEKPKLVHRLDKDTSGVLVLARNIQVASYLGNLFQTHTITKNYWAFIHGVPNQLKGNLSWSLTKKFVDQIKEKVTVDIEGDYADTYYEVIENIGKKFSWIILKPLTGRTHQLRVHCAAMGHPIIGDNKYGHDKFMLSEPFVKKLYLHARSISFIHPISKKEIKIQAPLPDYMVQLWNFFGLNDQLDYEI
ncbi:MAG: RluA family pseudouridine synthase [Alphaproteobacteria bacterium]|nr:RluA family pseudouridine synthase [Alphaproteobacteria bacterium]